MARPRARLNLAQLADAFAPDGLHGTSSSALAAATGLAKPTLYAHGESKHALFLRAVEAEVERVVDRLHHAERATAGQPARVRATAAARALLEHAGARPAGARLLTHTARHTASPVAGAVALALQRIPDRVAGTLRRDLAADGLDPAPATAMARALCAAAWALGEARPGERRPSRAVLAGVAAALVPVPAPAVAQAWPPAS